MKRLSLGSLLGLLTLVLLVSSGCDVWSRRVKAGEEFTLGPNEKIVVSGSSLGIRLVSVGHTWYVDRHADSVFATLTITGGGAPQTPNVEVGHTKTVGEYDIRVESAEEPRSNAGPSCKLVVVRRR